MEGCIAASEVAGISSNESSVFGKIAEDLIYMDFAKRTFSPLEIYVDDNNQSSYLYFLKRNNPSLMLRSFVASLSVTRLGMVRPDLLIHASSEKAFYEIKPNSTAGVRAGINKVGTLSATYIYFHLPYIPGISYSRRQISVASLAGQLTVNLKAELKGPGLIVYDMCLNSNELINLVTLSAILRYVIKKMNEQAGSKKFRPIDLRPAFAHEGELVALAGKLGLVMAVSGVAAVGWRYFWKAVAKRFAARGATASLLAAADGPLPVGDLIAAGMALWTVIDIIRLSNELWVDAAKLANQGA